MVISMSNIITKEFMRIFSVFSLKKKCHLDFLFVRVRYLPSMRLELTKRLSIKKRQPGKHGFGFDLK